MGLTIKALCSLRSSFLPFLLAPFDFLPVVVACLLLTRMDDLKLPFVGNLTIHEGGTIMGA